MENQQQKKTKPTASTVSYKTNRNISYAITLHCLHFLFAIESRESSGCFYREVLAVVHSLLAQLDLTQSLMSQKDTVQKKIEHNGPEHWSNTGDKCPDRLRTAAQTHSNIL